MIDAISRVLCSVLPSIASISFALLAPGCASMQVTRDTVPDFLFADSHFGPAAELTSPDGIFLLSDSMRDYLRNEFRPGLSDAQTALAEALYKNGQLKLEYESSVTRTAAEAFNARAGNCLSLVIMTASFAKELGLQVRYQSAQQHNYWSLKGGLLVNSGHVNITLGRRMADISTTPFAHEVTIDFLPREALAGLKVQEVPESIVVSMFMNNRAVEAMIDGRTDDAYAWARGSIVNNPTFVLAQNTLGLVYLRKGLLSEASTVFEHLLAVDAGNGLALANLSEVRVRQGKLAEAAELRRQLSMTESHSPLQSYRLGLEAMRREDFRAARLHFAREARMPNAPAEVRWWLGIALYRLGEVADAAAEIARAAETSDSQVERSIYSAKLRSLEAIGR